MVTRTGTEGNDTLAGTNPGPFGIGGDDVLRGRGGDDIIFGKGGDDRLEGGSGDDNLSGEGGGDDLFGDSGDDLLFGGAGRDALFGGTDDDLLFGGTGNDNLRGEGGNDHLLGGSGNDRLFGGSDDDELFGGGGNDKLFGEAGDDTLVWFEEGSLPGGGFGEEDAINGGSGFDNVQAIGFGFADFFNLGARGGSDQAAFVIPTTASSLVTRNVEAFEVEGRGGDDRLTVGDLSGTSVQEVTFRGGDGGDSIAGFEASTRLIGFGEAGGDSLTGGSDGDILDGGAGGDGLNGNEGNDFLIGGIGMDGLLGGIGNDTLDGGADSDILIGAENLDRFNYDAGGGGTDRIVDFRAGDDDIFVEGSRERAIDTADPGDDVIDANDSPVSVIDSNLVIDFGGRNSLTVHGVTQLAVNADIFFV